MVTPEHKIWGVTNKGNILIKEARELISRLSPITMIKSEGITNDMNDYKTIGIVEQLDLQIFNINDFFCLAGMFIGDGFLVHTTNKGIAKTGFNRKRV